MRDLRTWSFLFLKEHLSSSVHAKSLRMSLEERLAKVKSPNLQNQQHVSHGKVLISHQAPADLAADQCCALINRRYVERPKDKFYSYRILCSPSCDSATMFIYCRIWRKCWASDLNRLLARPCFLLRSPSPLTNTVLRDTGIACPHICEQWNRSTSAQICPRMSRISVGRTRLCGLESALEPDWAQKGHPNTLDVGCGWATKNTEEIIRSFDKCPQAPSSRSSPRSPGGGPLRKHCIDEPQRSRQCCRSNQEAEGS